jgi:hypothetical protein
MPIENRRRKSLIKKQNRVKLACRIQKGNKRNSSSIRCKKKRRGDLIGIDKVLK